MPVERYTKVNKYRSLLCRDSFYLILYWRFKSRLAHFAARFGSGFLANIIEFCPAHARCAAHDFNFINNRRVKRPNALNTYSGRNLAHGKSTRNAAAVFFGNHKTFKSLKARFIAFFYFLHNPNGITRLDINFRWFHRFLLYHDSTEDTSKHTKN